MNKNKTFDVVQNWMKSKLFNFLILAVGFLLSASLLLVYDKTNAFRWIGDWNINANMWEILIFTLGIAFAVFTFIYIIGLIKNLFKNKKNFKPVIFNIIYAVVAVLITAACTLVLIFVFPWERILKGVTFKSLFPELGYGYLTFFAFYVAFLLVVAIIGAVVLIIRKAILKRKDK